MSRRIPNRVKAAQMSKRAELHIHRTNFSLAVFTDTESKYISNYRELDKQDCKKVVLKSKTSIKKAKPLGTDTLFS